MPRLSSLKLTHIQELQELDRFWNVESINSSTHSVVDQFEKDIIHDGTRYITKLPFKPDHEVFPDNFKVCEGRLKTLKNKLVASNYMNMITFSQNIKTMV